MDIYALYKFNGDAYFLKRKGTIEKLINVVKHYGYNPKFPHEKFHIVNQATGWFIKLQWKLDNKSNLYLELITETKENIMPKNKSKMKANDKPVTLKLIIEVPEGERCITDSGKRCKYYDKNWKLCSVFDVAIVEDFCNVPLKCPECLSLYYSEGKERIFEEMIIED